LQSRRSSGTIHLSGTGIKDARESGKPQDHLLGTTPDGPQKTRAVLGEQQKGNFARGLLNDLEQGVAGFFPKTLGSMQDEHLVPSSGNSLPHPPEYVFPDLLHPEAGSVWLQVYHPQMAPPPDLKAIPATPTGSPFRSWRGAIESRQPGLGNSPPQAGILHLQHKTVGGAVARRSAHQILVDGSLRENVLKHLHGDWQSSTMRRMLQF
jgi:hypothetical protein